MKRLEPILRFIDRHLLWLVVLALLFSLRVKAPAAELVFGADGYGLTDSHHAEHVALGAVVGAVSTIGLCVDEPASSPGSRIVAAAVVTLAAGLYYEQAMVRAGLTTQMDVLDALYTGAGGLIGASLVEGGALLIMPGHDGVAVELAWSF